MRNLYCVVFAVLIGLSACKKDDKDEVKPETPTDGLDINWTDSLFESVYIPKNGFEDFAKTVKVKDGKPLRVIEDELGNNSDMIFRGMETHTSPVAGLPIAIARYPGDQPPVYDANTGAVFIGNVQAAHYYTNPFADDIRNTPFEFWAVVRAFRTEINESLFSPGKYMPHMRLRNNEYWQWGTLDDYHDYTTAQSGQIPWLEKVVIRMKYNPPYSQLYISDKVGEQFLLRGLGEVSSLQNIQLQRLGFGSNGHPNNTEYFVLGYVIGVLSETQADSLLVELVNNDVEMNALPQQAVALPSPESSSLPSTRMTYWNTDNQSWYLYFVYNAENGLPEDVAKREYQWYYADPVTSSGTTNFLNNQHKITGATSATLKWNDYAIGNQLGNPEIFDAARKIASDPKIRVCASIKLYDTEGNSFGEVQSDWVVDNLE